MKYWLLTTEYPPHYGGGIGTYCYQWCKILVENGVAVTVFIPDKAQKEIKVFWQEGVRMVAFSPYLGGASSFLGYETMISHSFAAVIQKFVQSEGVPRWLESQEYNGIAYYLLQKKHLGYPFFKDLNVVVTCHCPSFLTFAHNHINTFQLPYFWIGEMERFSIQAADVCISPSKYLVKQLQQHYPALKRDYKIVPNPFRLAMQVQVPMKRGNEVVFIGKLSPAKGVLQTLKAFSKLWQEGSKVPLKLIGDASYYYHAVGSTMGAYIKRKYSSFLKSGLLKMAGVLLPEQLQTEIRNACLIVVPSTIENLPYVVIECMAAGKMVLSSTQGGQRELIQDGVNGFLFDNNTEAAYIDKLQSILDMDEEQSNILGQRAIATIRELCNPQDYYTAKMQLLNQHTADQAKTFVFPFISGLDVNTQQTIPKTTQKSLLSVVVPFYNLGKYLHETIASILASDYKNLEVLIVDDGSSEMGKEALEEYKIHQQIKIITQKNKGLSATRNTGAQAAKGEFLAFLDADDKVSSTYYSKAIEVLQYKENVHFVGCWVQYFEGSTNVWPAFTPEPPYLLFHNMVNSSGLVYRRASFLQAGINDEKFIYGMEDYDSVLSMVGQGFLGVVLPEIHFYYRVRKDSMARGFNKSNMTYLYQLLTQKHTELYTNFATEITNLLNVNGPGYQYENPTLDYHIHPGNNIYDRLVRKAKLKIKNQPVLRRLALTFYQKLKS